MSERLICPHCGMSFRSPATYSDHLKRHQEQPATQMLTRKMQELMAKKKKLPIDTTQRGIFPEAASESVEDRMNHIRAMVRELNELKLARLSNIVNAVRSSLKSRRLKRLRKYNYLGIVQN